MAAEVRTTRKAYSETAVAATAAAEASSNTSLNDAEMQEDEISDSASTTFDASAAEGIADGYVSDTSVYNNPKEVRRAGNPVWYHSVNDGDESNFSSTITNTIVSVDEDTQSTTRILLRFARAVSTVSQAV